PHPPSAPSPASGRRDSARPRLASGSEGSRWSREARLWLGQGRTAGLTAAKNAINPSPVYGRGKARLAREGEGRQVALRLPRLRRALIRLRHLLPRAGEGRAPDAGTASGIEASHWSGEGLV